MKNVVITGAGGFIGRNLTQKLLSNGITVYGIDIFPERLDSLRGSGNLITIEANLIQNFEIKDVISDNSIDAFFHLAWKGYGKDSNNFDIQLENVRETYNAAHAAGKLNCANFIIACSSHEYQKSSYNDVIGNAEGPSSIYGASKTAAKAYAKVVAHKSGMGFNGAIFTNVFGVGDYSNRTANYFIQQLLEGKPLNLVLGDKPYDWVYIDDVVEGLIRIAEKGIRGKEYYVGNTELRPFRQIIEEVRDIIAPQVEINCGAYNDTSYIDYSSIDTYELYRDTGFLAKCDFKESIRKTVDWLQTNNKAGKD